MNCPRSGRIAGLLVIVLLALLIPAWLFGHLIAKGSPTARTRLTPGSASGHGSASGQSVGVGQPLTKPLTKPLTEPVVKPIEQQAISAEWQADVTQQNEQLSQTVTDLEKSLSSARDQIESLQQSSVSLSESMAETRADWEQKVRQLEQQMAERLAAPVETTATPQAADRTIRVWTAANGKQVAAAFLGMNDNDTVSLFARGKVFKLPLSELSEADQQYVSDLAR